MPKNYESNRSCEECVVDWVMSIWKSVWGKLRVLVERATRGPVLSRGLSGERKRREEMN